MPYKIQIDVLDHNLKYLNTMIYASDNEYGIEQFIFDTDYDAQYIVFTLKKVAEYKAKIICEDEHYINPKIIKVED